MSRVDELLAELAPNGVEYRALGDLVRIPKGSVQPRAMGDREVVLFSLPAFDKNQEPERLRGTLVGSAKVELDRAAVLVPKLNPHIPRVWRVEALPERSYCSPEFYALQPDSQMTIGFLYHLVLSQIGSVASVVTGSTNSHKRLAREDYLRLDVPVPPIEVQREVVRILDAFTELEAELGAELEAELEAREAQYSEYRDGLVEGLGLSSRTALMGEAGEFFGGLSGKSKADFVEGNAPFVSYMNVFSNAAVDFERVDRVRINEGEKQRTVERGDILFTGSSESRGEVGMTSVVTVDPASPTYLNSFCIGYRLSDPDLLDPNYSKHLFRSRRLREQIVATASGVTRFNLSRARMATIEFPVPPLAEQRRIADVLDSFNALVNDLRVGLPAELKARRQQFEFYRDKLLTFPEAS